MRAGLVIWALIAAAALPLAKTPQQPTFRTATEVVTVDVHVTDQSGRPVVGLRPEDFAITVEGRSRPIVAADYVSYSVEPPIGANPARSAPAPLFASNRMLKSSTPPRTVLIAFDEENVTTEAGGPTVAAIGRFIGQLQPDDRLGLVVIPRAHVAIDPTTDRRAVTEALKSIIGRLTPVDVVLGSSHSVGQSEAFTLLHDPKRWSEVVARECEPYRGDAGRTKMCESDVTSYARAATADSRRRQADSMRSLVALFDSLAQLPGVKTVVLVSQQLPVPAFAAERLAFNAEAKRLAQAAARSRATVFILQLDAPRSDVQRQRPLASEGDDRAMAASGLEDVSSVTGGVRLLVSGRPEGAMDRIAVEMSGYYLLGFQSDPTDRDGVPHEINVTLRRKGVAVRARQMFNYAGQSATTVDSASANVNRVLRAADLATGIGLSVTAYALRNPASAGATGDAGAIDRMRVLLAAEVDRGAGLEDKLAVGYTITDAAGRNAGASVEEATLTAEPDDPFGPLYYLAAAVVPPGTYTLRFAAAKDAVMAGSVVHRFTAQPTTAPPFALSDLVVSDTRVSDGRRLRPSVTGAVRDGLLCYLEVYVSSDAGASTGLKELSAVLEVAEDVDAPPKASKPMVVQGPDATGTWRLDGTLDTRALSTGNYIARVVVQSAGKGVGRAARPIRVVHAAASPRGEF
jgi:VWFA-related protein